MLDQDRASVQQLADMPLRAFDVAIVLVDVVAQHASRRTQRGEIAAGHTGHEVRTGEPIHFQIAVVAEDNAFARIDHDDAGRQAVERAGNESRAPDIGVTRAPQRARNPEDDGGEKRGDHEAAHRHLPYERGVRDFQSRCRERAIGIGDDLRGGAARRQNGAETYSDPHRARCGRSCLLLPAGHYHSAEFFIRQCLAVPLWIG